MLDVNSIIDTFLDTKSLSEESKTRLIKLKQDLNYCSPELLLDKFFNGNHKGTLGLCEILSTYEIDNQEILNLYKNFINYYKNLDESYVDYQMILESKPFFNEKYIYYYQSKKIQNWFKKIAYKPKDGIFYKKAENNYKKLQLNDY